MKRPCPLPARQAAGDSPGGAPQDGGGKTGPVGGAPERRAVAEIGLRLAQRYPGSHSITTNKLLYDYVQELKQRHMRTAPGVSKVVYDDRLVVVDEALGLHTFRSRAHGAKLRAVSEIRIAGLFRATAPEFLRMIVVHELAHLREKDHNKAFYRLCESMEPDYHQLEHDLRLLLALGPASTTPRAGP
jgi:UTP pyrophosphatase